MLLAGLSACTSQPILRPDNTWEGRLAVQILSEPPQEFFANFELTGSQAAGSLALFTPLGSTLLQLRWDANHAELIQGAATLRRNSLADLQSQMQAQVPVTSLPIGAWFDWLKGRPTTAPGWQADLSDLSQGRLTAHRHDPSPEIRVKLIFTSSPAPT